MAKEPGRRRQRKRSDAREPRARTEGGPRRGAATRRGDERSPTRSGIQYPRPRYRRVGEPVEPAPRRERPVLRTVRGEVPPPKAPPPARARKTPPPARGGRPRRSEAMEELAHLAGRDARRAQDQLGRAADAFAAGRGRDAIRLLRPLRDEYPDASAVRELLGLAHYRSGQFPSAHRELRAFVKLTDSVEQHPVLMDCARALGRYRQVDELWDELAAASPSAALVTEGRIVYAGALADRGRLRDAIAVLERRAEDVRRAREHHLRLWYVLADLHERAGDLPRARALFERITRRDPAFADVAERLAALG